MLTNNTGVIFCASVPCLLGGDHNGTCCSRLYSRLAIRALQQEREMGLDSECSKDIWEFVAKVQGEVITGWKIIKGRHEDGEILDKPT